MGAALALVASAGCGVDEGAERAKDRAAQKREQAREDRATAERRVSDATEVADVCDAQMSELLDGAKELGSRLDVGLSYDEYTDEVADLKVAYDGIDFDASADSIGCLGDVGLPLEAAMNTYLSAARIWDDCFDDYDCDTDSIEPDLQAKWSKADRKVDEASDGLDGLHDDVEDARAELASLR